MMQFSTRSVAGMRLKSALLTCILLFHPHRALSRTYEWRKLGSSRSFYRNLQLFTTTAASGSQPWYKDGLSFSCTLCGTCCSGTSGTVHFSKEEGIEMAETLNIDVDVFYEKYTRRRGRGKKTFYELKEVKSPVAADEYDCIFLDRNKIPGKSVCSLYHTRPLQCKTWPFWPELLEDRASWEAAKTGRDGCPGLGKGNVIAFEEIERQKKRRLRLLRQL